jgi:hypothetical protein
MIDWNRHKMATHAAVTFFDEAGKSVGFKRLDRPTQTKTVADAVEQEGEKWTHGDKCYCVDFDGVCEVVLVEGSQVVVRKSSGNLGVSYIENLDPIKPTLTKEQHEFLCKFSADSNNLEVIAEVESYLSKHEII